MVSLSYAFLPPKNRLSADSGDSTTNRIKPGLSSTINNSTNYQECQILRGGGGICTRRTLNDKPDSLLEHPHTPQSISHPDNPFTTFYLPIPYSLFPIPYPCFPST